MTRSLILILASLLTLTLAVGCGEDDGASADTASADASSSGADTSSSGADASETSDAATAEGATLFGTVTRSGAPAAGGVGDIFIGVFERDPVATPDDPPEPVVNLLIEDADMSMADAAIGYEISGIPPRSEPYFISAFLDDNQNATVEDAGPDRGDLVTLDNFSSPSVTISEASRVEFVIDLNFNLPF